MLERSAILLGWTCCIFKVKMPLLAIQLSRMLDEGSKGQFDWIEQAAAGQCL